MLVLSRRLGESVMIGDAIKVTILSANGTQVRIGIEAPKEISVHRQEVYRRIHGEPSNEEPEKVLRRVYRNEG